MHPTSHFSWEKEDHESFSRKKEGGFSDCLRKGEEIFRTGASISARVERGEKDWREIVVGEMENR